MGPSKEQLIEDYFVLKLTQDEIAKKYGYKTRQVIGRLLKKYNIKLKTKSELVSDRMSKNDPSKEELVRLYETHSISEIAKKLNLCRKYISKLMEKYEIENKYFKYFIDEDQLIEDLTKLSLKEIEIKHNVPLEELKRRLISKIKVPKLLYSIERIKEILSLYDLNNQGFPKQIIYDDPNVYNSILEHTKDHIFQSDKITERIYRILNNYSSEYIPKCKETGDILKFYTLEKGYGSSDRNVTRKGYTISCFFGSPSRVSQKLFWDIYALLNDDQKSKVEFGELNKEKKIKTNSTLNKYHIFLDFCLDNKNIEFDGEYWHNLSQVQIQDKLRDKFLTESGYKILRINEKDYYNNPEETINRCIRFLKE